LKLSKAPCPIGLEILTILQKKEGLMESIARDKRGWKKKVLERREAVKAMTVMDEISGIDVRVDFIQALIPL